MEILMKEKFFKQEISFSNDEKKYVKLIYDDIKKISDELIEENKEAYKVLAND